MLHYSLYLISLSFFSLLSSLFLLFNNTFISIEIPLINIFSMYIPFSMSIDWISCLFMFTVSFISSMVILFSINYIPQKDHNKFIIMLIMFVSSMNLLILSDNIIIILLGWDGLGLSSYILVVFYQNYSTAASGTLTFLSNRIGDIMILLAISTIIMNSNWNFIMNESLILISTLFIVIAACTKSAQFPFSAWLPAAMAAPTPISALVHSSTLVTAGVYILIRILNNIHPFSQTILMMTATATSIYASMAANWEQDLKKIIALSTLSQIAMMMFAVSMKSTLLAFFHLITHALFKSTMFLCAGNMIHTSSYQDMRMMGAMMKKLPLTMSILGLSNLALMGIPFMSGFFSKDAIIEMLLSTKMNSFLSFLMISSIGMTISYSIRMIFSSSKFLIKSKPDSSNHNNLYTPISITLISPTSILSGSTLMWILTSEQLFIIPPHLKFSIPLTIMSGLIIGYSLSFKNKNFINVGMTSISLWFIHHLSNFSMPLLSPSMNLMNMNDKSWQEMYGPQGLFILTKTMSKSPTVISSTLMMTMIMISIIPIFMI